MKLSFLILALWGFCQINSAAEKKKEIYAHYMGCFPVATGPTEHHRNNDSEKIRHDSNSYVDLMGGRFLNWDLVPPKTKLSAEKSAEIDIKRAIRGGIDGFAIDAWAGGEGTKRTLNTLFKVAEEQDLPFKITICLDPSCLPKDKDKPGNKIQPFADAIKYLLDQHGKSTKLPRRDGKPLIFGYHSRGILNTPEMKGVPEGPEKWDMVADAYKQMEKLVGQPIYLYFGIGAFFHQVPKQHQDFVAAARWAGKNFPAVGSFLDTDFWQDEIKMAEAIKAGGAEWGQPLWYQYNNRSGSLNVDNGFNVLRDRWKRARDLDSTLIQFITWNDYGEDTVLAPGYNTGYTVLEINKYFIDWWKSGKIPVPEKDKMFIVFRKYGEDAKVFPFKSRRFRPGLLEIVTILTEPGEVILPGRDMKFTAPAGISFKQFPLKLGKVEAKLTRNNKEIICLTAPEQVTDKPFRPDNSMVCFSSEYEKNWKLDFPEEKTFYYSEYSDDDKDGLPNWFEMYWFGKFLDFSTATNANPGDDPDKDGLTNLQEYMAQTDPTKPEPIYKKGDVWDMATVHKKQSSFNPDGDFNDTPVWYYLYQHGEQGTILRDGNYELCPHNAKTTPYTGPMVHISPYSDSKYKYIHGWICRNKAADGHWQLVLRPRVQALIVLGWQSPVNGTIAIEGKIEPVAGQDGITFEINKGTDELYKKVLDVGEGSPFKLDSIKINKGEFIYFIADSMPGGDGSQIIMDSLKITLLDKKGN